MAVTVRIPIALRRLTQGHAELHADAATVVDLVEDLDRRFPGLRERLVDDAGHVRHFVGIYVNDEDIRFLQGQHTPLASGDCVAIVPAIAGGSRGGIARADGTRDSS